MSDGCASLHLAPPMEGAGERSEAGLARCMFEKPFLSRIQYILKLCGAFLLSCAATFPVEPAEPQNLQNPRFPNN